MAGCFWTWSNYNTAITGKNTSFCSFQETDKTFLYRLKVKRLTCLCARSLRFVPSTYRSVLVSESTLLSLSVFFHSVPSPVLSCAQSFLLLHLSTSIVPIQNEKHTIFTRKFIINFTINYKDTTSITMN